MIIKYIFTEVENVKETFFGIFFLNYDRHLVTSSNSSVIFLFPSLFLMHLHLPHTWLWSELSHLKVRTFSGTVFFSCILTFTLRNLVEPRCQLPPSCLPAMQCGHLSSSVSQSQVPPPQGCAAPQPLSFLSQPLPLTEHTQGHVLNLPPLDDAWSCSNQVTLRGPHLFICSMRGLG